MIEFVKDTAKVFGRALRLLFFFPVKRYPADPSRTTIVALITMAIGATAVAETSVAGDHSSISGPGVIIAIGGWLVFAMVLWLSKPRYALFGLPRVLADSAALSTLTTLMSAGAYALCKRYADIGGWSLFAVFAGLILWWAVALWRAGRHAWTGSQWRFGFRPVQYAAIIALLLPDAPMVRGNDTQPGFDIWRTAQAYYSYYAGYYGIDGEDEDGAPVKLVDVEQTYYRQPLLVQQALDKVQPSDPTRSELYFLAAASFADQDVFKSEVEKTRALFDQRFATAGHSIVAINHADTVDDLPLANVSNMTSLLAGLARKMDTENDVLVMFLTSHGSPGRFSVSFSGFSLNDLTPQALRTMLDASGIKNRVLIISACYSGSFIDMLADDNTLVITAASDKRTSFGCSNEREWTFFGDAFFNHALRETYSFEAAYAKARETVGGWEREQGITPSDPQMSAGHAIHAKLKEVAQAFAQNQAKAGDASGSVPGAAVRRSADAR
ncbi:MAG: C13 family peptidase [Hyphomicrobiaceae bacterium]